MVVVVVDGKGLGRDDRGMKGRVMHAGEGTVLCVRCQEEVAGESECVPLPVLMPLDSLPGEGDAEGTRAALGRQCVISLGGTQPGKQRP